MAVRADSSIAVYALLDCQAQISVMSLQHVGGFSFG
jgi:hypothetical protein